VGRRTFVKGIGATAVAAAGLSHERGFAQNADAIARLSLARSSPALSASATKSVSNPASEPTLSCSTSNNPSSRR